MCKSKFSQRSSLKTHISFVHEKKKPYECSIYDFGIFCDYRCSQKSDLKRHIALVHEREKKRKKNQPLKIKHSRKCFCETCQTNFATLSSKRRHVSDVHEGKKPYKCKFCDYSCARKGVLERHIESVHEKKKIKNLDCNCEDREMCPVDNKCLLKNCIYIAIGHVIERLKDIKYPKLLQMYCSHFLFSCF